MLSFEVLGQFLQCVYSRVKNGYLVLEGAVWMLSSHKHTRREFSIRCIYPVNFKALAQIAFEIIGGSHKNDKVQTFSGSIGRNAARRSTFAQQTHFNQQWRCAKFWSSRFILSMCLLLVNNGFLRLEGAIWMLSFRKHTRKQFSKICIYPVNFKALA